MCDLDLDPMTLIHKYDPDVVKMYHHTKYEDSMSNASNVTDEHTHRQDTQTGTAKTSYHAHTDR